MATRIARDEAIRYLVKARADAPEKGPYTRAQLEQSLANGLLKGSALVRALEADKATTLTELLTGQELRKARDAARMNQELAEDEARRSRKAATSQIVVGAACAVVGLVMTLFGFLAASSSGGGRYVVFTGLIAFGLAWMVRGFRAR